jgi:hypothetical protein
MHQPRLYADYTTLGLGSLRSHLSNAQISSEQKINVKTMKQMLSPAEFGCYVAFLGRICSLDANDR